MPKIDLDAMIDDLEKGLDPIEPYILSWPRKKSKITKKPLNKLISKNKVYSALIQMDSGMYPDLYTIDDETAKLDFYDEFFKLPIAKRTPYRRLIQSFRILENRLLTTYIIKRLREHDVRVGKEFKSAIWKMSLVLIHNRSLDKPAILTARPGLGKTESLIATLIVRSKVEPNFTAVVVAQRVEDLVKIREEVNETVAENVCWIRPSFTLMTLNGKKCDNGYSESDPYDITLCRDEKCKMFTCPVKKRNSSFRPYRIFLITTEFFHITLDSGKLNDLRVFQPESKPSKTLRKYLFIDENPGMIFSSDITDKLLHDSSVHLKRNQFDRQFIDEFINVKGKISQLIGGEKSYEYVETIDQSYKLSSAFAKAWRKNPHKDYYNLPEVVNSLVDYGGIRQNDNAVVAYLIAISKYRSIHGENLRTVILDGTGMKDLTYRSHYFNILSIKEFRSYARATIHHYPKSLSKDFLKKDTKNKISVITREIVIKVGKRKTLVIVYKRHKKPFSRALKPHSNIQINHFGNLIGRNKYRDCTKVFFAGLIDYGPKEYLSQLTAVLGKEVDLGTTKNKKTQYTSEEVAEYCSSLMALSTYQDIMRSNLRVTGCRKVVGIYLWTKNSRIIDHLVEWLPNVNLITESIPASLRSSRQPTEISTEAKSKLDPYKDSMTDEHLNMKPKQRAEELARILNRVPLRVELEYVWKDVWSDSDRSHCSRYKKYAEEYLKAQK